MICPHCQTNNTDGASRCLNCGASLASAVQSAATAGNDPVAGANQFGERFNRALELWKAQLGDVVVLTLVFLLVVWIPIANLAFAAGYVRSLLKVTRGQGRAQVGDIFNAWDGFANLFVFGLLLLVVSFILNWIPLLGQLATLLLGLLAFPGSWRIIDRNVNFTEAFSWSVAALQSRPLEWVLAYLVGAALASVGAMVFGIGLLFTLPLATLLCAQVYVSQPAN